MTVSVQPTKPPQLQMIWPQARPAPALSPVPSGYTLRTYRDGDQNAYIALMQRSGFEAWSDAKAQRVFETMLPAGLFFLVDHATGTLVATAAAQARAREHHPLGMELGWVASDPKHRGKGLGYIVCAAATRRLLAAHPATMYLLTDDSRLPAIHVYFKLGWIPFLYLPQFEERWRAVCNALGIAYESIKTTTDPAGR
jgi:mycothiol synthase